MTVNDSRSMNAEFNQGTTDSTYICLTPNRGNVENPPVERLAWPIYREAELYADSPFKEVVGHRFDLPREYATANARASAMDLQQGQGGIAQSDSDLRI